MANKIMKTKTRREKFSWPKAIKSAGAVDEWRTRRANKHWPKHRAPCRKK